MPFFNWHSLGLRRIKVSVKSFDHYIKPFSILLWNVLAHCSPRPRAIARACTGTHTSKLMCAIYPTHKISIFTFCFVIIIYFIVCTPLPFLLGGLNLLPNFQKRGAWQDLDFERGIAGKEGVTFFRWSCNFHKKNKLKSEMFNDKKSL